MWGIIPAAGNGTRIQPLAFSKELLPVGSRFDGDTERPRAVSEYLSSACSPPARTDLLCHLAGEIRHPAVLRRAIDRAAIAYVVQPELQDCAMRSSAQCR